MGKGNGGGMPAHNDVAARQGRHAAQRRRVSPDRAVCGRATRVWAFPAGVAVAAAVLVFLLAAALAEALGKAIAWMWGRLRPGGQLVAGAVACMLGGALAGDINLIPDRSWWPDAAGAVMAAVFGAVYLMRQRRATERGQREWPRRARSGGAVVKSGWKAYRDAHEAEVRHNLERVYRNEARLEECGALLEEQQAQIMALFDVMARACAAAGVQPPEPSARPVLRIVRGGG